MRTAELNRSRKLGVEYEFSIPVLSTGTAHAAREVLASVLTQNGLPTVARPYCQTPLQPPHVLAVEHDASIGGENTWRGITWIPVELKTKILSGIDEWEQIVPQALTICSYLGGRATVRAGHHVHLGIPEVQSDPSIIRSLFNLFHRFEPVIYGLVPPSRRTSGYCRPIPSELSKLLHSCCSLRDYQRALVFDRHQGVNWTTLFSAEPHLELRYAGATVDEVKARHWVRFCLQMVEHAVRRNCQATPTQVARDRRGIDKLLTTCGFKANSRIYGKVSKELRETGRYLLLNRWRKFNPTQRQGHQPEEGLTWASDL